MRAPTFRDRWPGAPRVLFVGRADSAHARAWIELLEGESVNVRLFSPPESLPPSDDWAVPTYVSCARHKGANSENRKYLISPNAVLARMQRVYGSRIVGNYRRYAMRWLANVVRTWKPQIVHSMSLIAGGSFYDATLRTQNLSTSATWVLQLWGGADLWCPDGDFECRTRIDNALRRCDQLFDDNVQGIEYARSIGVREEQIAPLGIIPGNGGIDFDRIARQQGARASGRSSILWPKAYDSFWSRPAPVLEALKRVFAAIGPVHIDVLVTCEATRSSIDAFPAEMRQHFTLHGFVDRNRIIELLADSRVMLAPSLVDGVPNVMLEAMALGSLPVVSPLSTITAVVAAESNVLFADNNDPGAIASAIVRGMRDDELVDHAQQNNYVRARELADRSVIRRKILDYYARLIHPSHVVDHEH